MLQLGQWFCVGYMNREKEQDGVRSKGWGFEGRLIEKEYGLYIIVGNNRGISWCYFVSN